MHIVKVTSNIKSPNGESWSHELGKLNLLVGPNESGKSAIAEAVQLAVSGSAYGLFFRSAQVKTGALLSNLATTDELLFAEVEYEDGTTSRWEMVPGKQPKQTGARVPALPIGELRSALSGSATKANKFFAERLLRPIARKQFEKLLGDNEHDLSAPLDKIIPDYGAPLEPSDILKALDDAATWKRKSKAEAKAGTSMLAALGSSEPLDQDADTSLMESMHKATLLEWFSKHYKLATSKQVKDDFRVLARSLGTKEELKSLPGSAQLWDKAREMWMDEALHRATNRSRTRIRNAERAAKEFEALEKAISSALNKMLAKPLTVYARRVNAFLPKGDKFAVTCKGANFHICLIRGDEHHYALSGSAEARVLAAMGAALADRTGNAIIILDDRMWDIKTLSRTMTKLEKSPCQAFLMSTFKPRGRQRPEWKYVEVSSAKNSGSDEETESQLPSETGSASSAEASV